MMIPPLSTYVLPSPASFIQPVYPAPSAPMVADVGPVVPQRLNNGAQGYFQQMPGQLQSQLSVMLPFPAKYSAESSILSDLLLSGSPATKAQIARWSQEGLRIHAANSGDKLVLTVSGPSGQEVLMTSAALQLLTRPMMDEPTYRARKEDLFKSLQSTVCNPDYPVMSAVHKTMYGAEHPYGLTTGDLLDALQTQQLGQVQQRLGQALQFPEGATVSMVSSQPEWIQQQVVSAAIQQAGWFASPYRRGSLESTPAPRMAMGTQGPVYVPEENLKYARVIHCWKAPLVNDPDYPAFFLLKEVLGGMNSGFFKVLRTEKGLVYGTQQSYSPYAKAADYSVSAQVDYDKVNTTLEAVQQVVQDISRRPISLPELDALKRKALLALREQKESSFGLSFANNTRLSLDIPPIHPDIFQRAIQRVTPQDIQRVANRIFNPQTGSQVIGVSAPTSVLQQYFMPPKKSGLPTR